MSVPRATRLRVPSVLLLAALLSGCGMEAVDSRVRARAEVGVPDENALQILEETYICPHVMSPTGVVFDTRNVRKGKVSASSEDGGTSVFGPFVACGTELTAGEGLCPTCQNAYHTPGTGQVAYCPSLYIPGGAAESKQCNNRLGDYTEGRSYDCSNCNNSTEHPRVTIEALPQFRCPYCSEILDPVSIHRKNDQDEPCPWHSSQAHGGADRFEPGHCPNCNNYFSTDPSDIVTTIDVHEEIVCGSCNQPLDPSLNGCSNTSCALGGVVHNVDVFDGPCWRCGGTKMCPECGGSGGGTSGTYGSTPAPADCWFCYTVDVNSRSAESTGRCPECDADGFSYYTGGLPPGFKTFQPGPEGKALDSSARGWNFPADQRTGGGGGGDEAGESASEPVEGPGQ